MTKDKKHVEKGPKNIQWIELTEYCNLSSSGKQESRQIRVTGCGDGPQTFAAPQEVKFAVGSALSKAQIVSSFFLSFLFPLEPTSIASLPRQAGSFFLSRIMFHYCTTNSANYECDAKDRSVRSKFTWSSQTRIIYYDKEFLSGELLSNSAFRWTQKFGRKFQMNSRK